MRHGHPTSKPGELSINQILYKKRKKQEKHGTEQRKKCIKILYLHIYTQKRILVIKIQSIRTDSQKDRLQETGSRCLAGIARHPLW